MRYGWVMARRSGTGEKRAWASRLVFAQNVAALAWIHVVKMMREAQNLAAAGMW